jgi:hypothetical protein
MATIDAALAQSNGVCFKLKEHTQLEEKKRVIVETIRVTAELEKLSKITGEVDDYFEEIVSAAKSLGINTPAAQQCFKRYQDVEDKRKAIAQLREILHAEPIEIMELEAALKSVGSLKVKYGASFCIKEEAQVRTLLERIQREERLVEQIMLHIRDDTVTSTSAVQQGQRTGESNVGLLVQVSRLRAVVLAPV